MRRWFLQLYHAQTLVTMSGRVAQLFANRMFARKLPQRGGGHADHGHGDHGHHGTPKYGDVCICNNALQGLYGLFISKTNKWISK